jgi:hypothetical protein
VVRPPQPSLAQFAVARTSGKSFHNQHVTDICSTMFSIVSHFKRMRCRFGKLPWEIRRDWEMEKAFCFGG